MIRNLTNSSLILPLSLMIGLTGSLIVFESSENTENLLNLNSDDPRPNIIMIFSVIMAIPVSRGQSAYCFSTL